MSMEAALVLAMGMGTGQTLSTMGGMMMRDQEVGLDSRQTLVVGSARGLHVVPASCQLRYPLLHDSKLLSLNAETAESRTRKRLQKSMSEAAYPARTADVPDPTSNFGDVQANHMGRRRQSVKDQSIFANAGQRALSGGLPRRSVTHFGAYPKILITLTELSQANHLKAVARQH